MASNYFYFKFLENVIIEHVDIDWTVDFLEKILSGSATLYFTILAKSVEHIVSSIKSPYVCINILLKILVVGCQ